MDDPLEPCAALLARLQTIALRILGSQAEAPAAPATNRVTGLTRDILAAAQAALEQLEPEARLAFLLHDIFDTDLAELALTLGRSEADCRGLVERARRQVHRHPHRPAP
jgi:DNA-directed RNA polymerase specialized sigma24 family protein